MRWAGSVKRASPCGARLAAARKPPQHQKHLHRHARVFVEPVDQPRHRLARHVGHGPVERQVVPDDGGAGQAFGAVDQRTAGGMRRGVLGHSKQEPRAGSRPATGVHGKRASPRFCAFCADAADRYTAHAHQQKRRPWGAVGPTGLRGSPARASAQGQALARLLVFAAQARDEFSRRSDLGDAADALAAAPDVLPCLLGVATEVHLARIGLR